MEHDGPENIITGLDSPESMSCLTFTIHISKYKDDETHILVNIIPLLFYYYTSLLSLFYYYNNK